MARLYIHGASLHTWRVSTYMMCPNSYGGCYTMPESGKALLV
ncbi:MAG: hypothetical protein RLO19_14070 [Coleofasciculus sp. G2-EDA-02]